MRRRRHRRIIDDEILRWRMEQEDVSGFEASIALH